MFVACFETKGGSQLSFVQYKRQTLNSMQHQFLEKISDSLKSLQFLDAFTAT